MRTVAGAFVLLAGLAPVGAAAQDAPAVDERDQVIRELQDKMESLEAQLAQIQAPVANEPATNAGLEARLGEVIRQSPAEPLTEPSRLNFTAPALDAVSWSGHFRWRTTLWNDYPTGGGSHDSALSFDQSAQLGVDARISDKLTLHVELLDARVWGTDVSQRVFPDNNLEMTTAHLDITDVYDSGFNLRLGRQQIRHGAGRQFGDDPWLLQRVRYDAITADTELDESTKLYVHAIRLADGDSRFPNEVGPGGGADGDNADLYALYLTHDTGDFGIVDAFYIFFDSDPDAPSAFSGGAGAESQFHHYGARWAHEMDGVYWDVEFATQFGTLFGSRTGNYGFSNYAIASRVGYEMPDDSMLRGVWVGYDYATGGEDRFLQISPELHGWFGITDQVSWSNIRQFVIGVDFAIVDDEESPDRLSVSWRWQNLDDTSQGFAGYNQAVTAAAVAGDDDLGQELDVTYHVDCTASSAVDLGLGYFFPGDGYANALGNDDVKFAFVRYGIRF